MWFLIVCLIILLVLFKKKNLINLAYFSDDRGRVLTEMSIMHLDNDSFLLITAGAAQWHDLEVLRSGINKNSKVSIVDETKDWSCLMLQDHH